MQKDFHFYVTYALARKVGFPSKDAELLAWANQYTDELTSAEIHSIQTQSSDIVGNWGDEQIQMSVLIPFHFVPGSDKNHPWMVTRNSPRAKALVEHAFSNHNLIQFGISLHSYQDTFTHEKFSGWREDLNSCYPWYYLKSGVPNIGHAEMNVIPDIINFDWIDPRDGKRIDNKERAMAAAKGTFNILKENSPKKTSQTSWKVIKQELTKIFKLQSYDRRIDRLCIFSGNSKIDYKKTNKKLENKYKSQFVKAASSHLAKAMELFSDLPWLT
jgi:hypothetical protein